MNKDNCIATLCVALDRVILIHKDISKTLLANIDNELVITECKNILRHIEELEDSHANLAIFLGKHMQNQ
jgi:hypothetical protein